nr:reverse transcriptase [Tanacetum cinerariifolium]
RAIPVRDREQDSKRAYLCSLLLHQARKFKDNCSRPDHDISLMIWPGRPNHDIEGWDLFSKKKGDSISSSKPFLEDAVRCYTGFRVIPDYKALAISRVGHRYHRKDLSQILKRSYFYPSIVITAQPSPPSALGRSRASPECDFYRVPVAALGDIHWVIPQKTTQAIGNGSYALPAEINLETVLLIARPML